MIKKTFGRKLLSLFITVFLAGTILPASVISNSKPVFAADVPVQSVSARLSTVSAGIVHSLALSSDGTVWAWGDNSEGELGNNKSELQNSPVPVQVSNLTNVIAVAAGGAHSLALKKDGTVWGWGNNEVGQGGFGKSELLAGGPDVYIPDQYKKSYVPLQVQGLTNIVAIAAGADYSLALKADGTVWAWGNNAYGQLGTPSVNAQFTITPVQVEDDVNGHKLTDITKISAGSAFALALKKDGTVWTWGGLLVDFEGVHNTVSLAQQVHSLNDVISISAGWNHSLALKNDGTVWGWGSNELFQLGNRKDGESWNTPLQISELNHVHAVAAGGYLSLALKTDGTVWSFGGNMWGQLGNAVAFEEQPVAKTPVQVKGLTNVTAIASGLGFSIARQSGGTIWTWGANSEGQLGNNTYGGPIVTAGNNDPNGKVISGVNSPVKALVQVGSYETTSFTRLSGYDAMQTSVKISQAGWPDGASTVILATVVNFPDALAAAPLAHQYDAPVLLTESKHLTPSIGEELGRLKPSKIIIVGGTAVVSKEVEDFLKQNYDVTRLSGYDQY
ncbi:MAG: cell wall-binding repeat-containing protein, partial [Bacillota bacterium]|nr:cell wall-binding repeat-containing protein [Bacillota bacterium]